MSAASRMPTELLAMVFEARFNSCVNDRSRCKTRIAFLETCSRWRALALQTRVLWTSFFLHMQEGDRLLEVIDEQMVRSGTLPLTVSIQEEPGHNATLPSFQTRLVAMLARLDSFHARCSTTLLFELRDFQAHPAPELTHFEVVARPVLMSLCLPFFFAAPKLETLSWLGFDLRFSAALPALKTVDLKSTHQLAELAACAPNMRSVVLQLRYALYSANQLHIPSLRFLDLSCPNPQHFDGIRTPELVIAKLKFTDSNSGLQNLETLRDFVRQNCAKVYRLSLFFTGNFRELAGVLKVCRRLQQLELGDINWSTGFAAAFFRDMARADESGQWVCSRLEELTVHVVQLGGTVRTALIDLATARRACVPAAERPLCPLHSLVVVRSKEDQGMMGRRTNLAAFNKKLKEILLAEG